jgi:peptidoglycan/LPS O-acetylase OafA/YrhL
VTAIGLIRSRGLCGRGWSLVALALCVLAVLGTIDVAISSDSTGFRWWLLAVPLGACLLAVLLPVRNVLIGAALVMTACCFVGWLSVGIFYVPSFVALVFAIERTQR